MTFEWKLYTRDQNYRRQGEIDDYTDAVLTPILNDVGTWSLTLDRRSPAAAALVNPGWGITATRNDVPIFAGIVDTCKHSRGMDKNELLITGFTDEQWLVDRTVSPSPSESTPPYIVQVSDVRSGVGSSVIQDYVNVNLGPGAIPARRKANLAIGADPVTGAAVRGEARWDATLLAFIQKLAITANIGFRVKQVGTGLQFQTFGFTDRSSTVKFSIDLGNLAGFEYSRSRPKANYIYIGASGTGTARIVSEFSDSDAVAAWERIEGPLVDQGSTSDPTQIAQTGADALAQNSEQVSLSITPVETPTLMYGIHYFLGDTVTVQLEEPVTTPYAVDGQVVDTLRQVTINLTPDGPQTVTPTIGTPSRGTIFKVFKAFQSLADRANYQERR